MRCFFIDESPSFRTTAPRAPSFWKQTYHTLLLYDSVRLFVSSSRDWCIIIYWVLFSVFSITEHRARADNRERRFMGSVFVAPPFPSYPSAHTLKRREVKEHHHLPVSLNFLIFIYNKVPIYSLVYSLYIATVQILLDII